MYYTPFHIIVVQGDVFEPSPTLLSTMPTSRAKRPSFAADDSQFPGDNEEEITCTTVIFDAHFQLTLPVAILCLCVSLRWGAQSISSTKMKVLTSDQSIIYIWIMWSFFFRKLYEKGDLKCNDTRLMAEFFFLLGSGGV